MNLEQSIAAICEKHGLSSLSLSFYQTLVEGYQVNAFVHPRPSGCASGWGSTANEAISAAIANMRTEHFSALDEPIILDETA